MDSIVHGITKSWTQLCDFQYQYQQKLKTNTKILKAKGE